MNSSSNSHFLVTCCLILTETQEQRIDGDGEHVEKRGRYHPGSGGNDDHGQPRVVERVRLVDKRKHVAYEVQRFVEHEVKRRNGGSGYDDFADDKYEVGYLYVNERTDEKCKIFFFFI